jgi:hypothetical protein
MDWMLIVSSAVFFALCAVCAFVVNSPSQTATK